MNSNVQETDNLSYLPSSDNENTLERHNRVYTPAELSLFRDLADKSDAVAIGRALRRKPSSVAMHARKVNIKIRIVQGGGKHAGKTFLTWDEKDERKLIWLLDRGLSLADLATKLDRSTHAVSMKLYRMGLSSRSRLRSMADAGEIFGCNAGTIANYRDKLRLNFQAGVKDHHIVLIAQAILQTPTSRVKTTVRRLHEIIREYSDIDDLTSD